MCLLFTDGVGQASLTIGKDSRLALPLLNNVCHLVYPIKRGV